ncbi:SusC/RagA family TonB-linked outer membrane protein [Prevotella multiformis]|uniref:TonB-linked outer membrane protein, SusC/RagA family n=1 Tax=Prevotella multiformis DSM 16608 TaxID=888743 RepID=F0F482_9BACT|nr:TonB-dependent receptor [Prevotella multiformis]EGC21040.1 TonB-linked outer membrane protein, SusC/RagA family [Prevotella multiformis DSM 16608]
MVKRLSMVLAGLFLCIGVALAQTEISGTVVSADGGEPVVGASVLVVGTQMGTVTDIDGNFHLSVPEGKSQLRFQYVGLKTQIVPVKNGMRVVMKADAGSLDEVIVTGYGNFKKSSFTGAAASIDPGKLADVPVTSVQDKLAGSIPGVTVTSSSGAPGSVGSIRVRGMGSINAGNNPLYVIDGTPVISGDLSAAQSGYNESGTSALATLNSNDIESITVIKDAAAASLYGSRAANGVIVITTKSGKKGKTHVDFRSDWGFSNLAIDYRPMLGGDDRRALLSLGLKNFALYKKGMSEADAETFAKKNIENYAAKPTVGYDESGNPIQEWTDWKDLLFKTGHHQNYQVSLSGGSENTQFYTSLSYMKQTGITANQALERFTGNANLTHRFGHFTLNYSALFTKMNQQLANEGTSYASSIANYAFFQSPSSIAYLPDGSLASGAQTKSVVKINPLYEYEHSSDKSDIKRMLNSLRLDWNIWDALHLSEKVTYDYTSNTENILWDRYSNDGAPGAVMQRVVSDLSQLNGQTQLSYVKSFGLHNVDALLGYETEKYTYRYNYINGTDYPGDLYEFGNAGTTSAESNKSGYTLASWLGRVNYNYDNRYYAGVSYRRDGSSRLAKANRWGDFWSVSAAWRFGAEKFMEPVKHVLSDGKLRVSYGVNGTLPSNYYDYMSLYKFGRYYNGKSGMAIVGIGNPDLKWEKNRAFNVGLDLTFLDRISVTFDYYVRTTSDLIYDLPVSAVPGYFSGDSPYLPTSPKNVGSLRNNGYEVTITSNNIQTKDFSWTTSLNFGHNHNKLTKIYGDQDQIISGIRIHKVGEPYYSFYGYEYAGVDPATGKEAFYLNDGTADARKTTTDPSKAHKVIIGNHETSLEGGLSNNLTWKFIDFGLNFTFSLGGKAYDGATWQHNNGSYLFRGAVPAYYDINKTWKGPGDTSASQPVFQYGNTSENSSRWLMPTDYLRLKSLTLGLTAPGNWVSRFGLSKARFYFAASNLLTWKSKDLTVDPEMRVDGVCTFQTPALRTFTFGLELGF